MIGKILASGCYIAFRLLFGWCLGDWADAQINYSELQFFDLFYGSSKIEDFC